MIGKTVLVTGATSGIGLETARQLSRFGARVLVHGRTPEFARAAAADLSDRATGSVTPVWGDFTSLDEVSGLAAAVREETDRLDVLVNNAGVLMTERVLTADGNESTFQVNHLAAFLLTGLLESLLVHSAPARVVTVSSIAHINGEIDFDDLTCERGFDPYAAYAASKLANALFAVELAHRLAASQVTSNTLHPGITETRLLRTGFPGQRGAEPRTGAATPVYLADSPEVEEVSGRFFVNQRPGHHSPALQDAALRDRLWTVSERLVSLKARLAA